MNKPIKNVVIVGGGSAGWLSAGIIASTLRKNYDSGFNITLVESAGIPPIGVGEGTWPTMRRTLMDMGIDESEFINQCNVSFKQGAKFVNWVTGDDAYYHPLELPIEFDHHNLAQAWQPFSKLSTQVPDFATSVSQQPLICEHGLSPKRFNSKAYQGDQNYAYHLDAGQFTVFLQKHCTETLRVNHQVAEVEAIKANEFGDITSLLTKCGLEIEGDLFVDCTGFSSLLLKQHYGVPFKPCDDVLFADSALAVQVPYDDENAKIASHTISTAQSAGWVWDIGLSTRRGVGHVYSSRYINEEQAEKELLDYLRQSHANPESLEFRKIQFKPGHLERFWQNNCVAIGLSAGFLEPLEASALLLVEISARFVAEQFPASRRSMDVISNRFNETFLARWQSIIDFLKLHYMLTKRTDTAFWLDQNKPSSIPDSLTQALELWREHSPWHHDFPYVQEVFPAASYQYILYGMGFETAEHPLGQSKQSVQTAIAAFEQNAALTQQKLSQLSSNRTLLNHIAKHGISKN